jgi:hypothetical protein
MVLPLSLPLQPGVDVMRTPLQVGRGLVNSNLIRHRNGLIQKLAGCARMTNLTFPGICRALFPWQDLQGNKYLAVGTNQVLELFTTMGGYTIIQPVTHTSSGLSGPFTTTAGSNIVTVADAGFTTVQIGEWINIATLTYVNGLLLQGPYQVQTVPSSGTYTIAAATNATASGSGGVTLTFNTTSGHPGITITLGPYVFTNGQTITVGVSTTVGGLTLLGPFTVNVSGSVYSINGPGNASSSATGQENGGHVDIQYYVALPNESAASGAYGIGPYGLGPYGIGSGATTGSSGLQGTIPGALFLTSWSMDRWGQDLMFNWISSTIYLWVPPIAPGNVGQPVSGAPQAVTGSFVAAPQQQAMAYGIFSQTLGAQDPMLIGWCDVANLNAWTATATNQAGSFRLASGNLIVGGTWFGVTGLFWTDLDLWSMTYIGFPLVYGFNKVAPNCGLIAKRAFATIGTICVWMSQNDFFLYQGGAVQPLPCSVRDFIFDTLDTAYIENIHADSNTYGNEVTWWFPQLGSGGQCTGAVKWHAAGGEWDITQSGLAVSAWTDQSVLGPPIGTFYSGLLEQFETSIDFDGQILDSYIVSGFFQLAEGEEIIYVERVYPDFTLSAGAIISMTFYFADDMAEAENPALVRTYGPYTITSSTSYVIVRGRGRVMQIRVDCNQALNSFWRYGEPLVTSSIDGRK